MNKFLGLLTILITFSLTSSSQSFSKIWYFGNQAGLDFRSGSPVPFRSSHHRFNAGNVMEADANGNVILYTNGSDSISGSITFLNLPLINLGGVERVFNRFNRPVNNSDSLSSMDFKMQPSVLLKKPGPDSLYYLISALFYYNRIIGSIGYSVIDLNTFNNHGSISDSCKMKILVSDTSKFIIDALITQSLHANGKDYWVIAIFPFNKSNNSIRGFYYYSFILNNSGLQLIKYDSIVTNQLFNYATTIRFNHRGDKAASVTGAPNVTLLNFDNVTGSFGSFQVFNTPTLANALSFSSNDSLLYVGIRSATPANSEIRQFKVFDPNPNSTVYVIPGSRYASRNRFSSNPVDYNNVAGMQLGPDGKLYIGRCYSDTLDVIHNPNVPGVGCGYQRGYLPLGDTNSFVVTGFVQFPLSCPKIGLH